MKVIATNMYTKLNVEDKELKRIIPEGEEFEVSKERFKILNGNNIYNEIFVTEVKTNSNETKSNSLENNIEDDATSKDISGNKDIVTDNKNTTGRKNKNGIEKAIKDVDTENTMKKVE